MVGWLVEKLRQWSILVLGLMVIGGSIAVGALFQSGSGPVPPVEVTSFKQENATMPSPASQAMAPKATATPSAGKTVAPASTNSKVPSEVAKASGKESANANAGAAADSNIGAGPAGQAAAPIEHNHMPAAPTAGRTGETSPAAQTGDAAAGRQVFRKCQACHSIEPGKNGLGPSLAGIVGEKAAAVPNYNFSPAMKASNLTWDTATLDAYLTDPQKVVPGNKMPFPGLKTERERSAVIAFLRANSTASGAAAAAVSAPASPAEKTAAAAPEPASPSAPAAAAATAPATTPGSGYVPGVRYTLRSGIADGRMVFLGIGGSIDGQVNPLLSAAEGQVVQITLLNGEGAEHDIVFDQQGPGQARLISLEGARAPTSRSSPPRPVTTSIAAACLDTGLPAWRENF